MRQGAAPHRIVRDNKNGYDKTIKQITEANVGELSREAGWLEEK